MLIDVMLINLIFIRFTLNVCPLLYNILDPTLIINVEISNIAQP